ncbi:hypothetical protein AXG93_2931s1090 [Marchantia polymorpha subsp. ruderalis]|uniref:Ubiquinone biosynthesis monooxygenase COQ6, mitochondrial n=1 Tax=Marchantia polymorpha subsp. ruderalis TaxID=1480154 RepID=A0A176VVT1_MARPO|nr:hypothetical protein AXG93_2931s1090 [Marchantia polymorpha subsp. ruderalis]
MDHKRGHGSLDQSNEQSSRVKRHKDYSYQQPTHTPQNTRSSRLQAFYCQSEEAREAREARSSRVELASVEQLRSIAEKSAKSVNNLGGSSDKQSTENSVEQIAYEEYIPVLLSELASAKSAARSKWPLVLTDRRVKKYCHICPGDKHFRGWEALLIHAAKFQKEKTRKHRGYYRAIRDALLQSTDDQIPLPDIRQGPTSPLARLKRSSKGRWAPPVVIVDDKEDEGGEEEAEDEEVAPREKNGKDRDRGGRAKGCPIRPSKDPQLEEVLAVYSTGRNHQKKKVVVIPASQVGFIEAGLLKKSSCGRRSTQSAEHDAISDIMEGRWPGAKIKKYTGADHGTCSVASSTSTALCTTDGNRALQLGRPTSPKDRMQTLLSDSEQDKLEGEELRLKKPLEQNRHIFDEQQFDDKVQILVSRWRGGFKDSKVRKDDDRYLEFADARPLLPAKRLPKSAIEKNERFKDDVEKYALLNPSCRKQVSRQITVLEDELRRDKLVWLQEVEAVREQFQALADSVHDEHFTLLLASTSIFHVPFVVMVRNCKARLQGPLPFKVILKLEVGGPVRRVDRDGATMRIEKHLDTRTKNMKERIYDKRNFFMARKIQCMHNVKRIRREQDMQGLMDLWREEQRTFEKECQSAKKEKEKLIGLHEKIHLKAKESNAGFSSISFHGLQEKAVSHLSGEVGLDQRAPELSGYIEDLQGSRPVGDRKQAKGKSTGEESEGGQLRTTYFLIDQSNMRRATIRVVIPVVRWQKFRCLSQVTDGVPQVSSAQERPTNTSRESGDDQFDVVIVGGGMVGAAVGCGLASSALTRSLRVAIVDGNPATKEKYNKKSDAVPDSRVSAITPATVRFLKDVGAWENIQRSRHAPFDAMQVWDYSGLGYTRYQAADVGEDFLGYVVENNLLISSLASALESDEFVTISVSIADEHSVQRTGFAEIICPATVQGVQFPAKTSSSSARNLFENLSERAQSHIGASTCVREQKNVGQTSPNSFALNDDWAQVMLEGGRLLRTRLVVGADGGRSRVRDMAGLETRGWDYNQHALICTVRVGYHHSTAWQRFLPTGPLALLPVGEDMSNIVWSTTPEKAKELKAMSKEDFVTAVNRALTEDFGPLPSSRMGGPFNSKWLTPLFGEMPPSVSEPFIAPPPVTACLSDRLSFPLSLRHATKYVSNRVALVGDAAHTVHPLAGQGVNLGFGDAATLVETLREGIKTGQDIGELALLEKYEKERLWANLPMMAVLDGFQRVFGTDFPLLNIARAGGFNAVQYIGPLKKRIISFAMGS